MTPLFSVRNFSEAGRRPIVAVLVGCGLAFYVAYHLTKFQLAAVWPPALRGDASILFDYSQSVLEQRGYPADTIFPYSPSAVLIFCGLGIGGPTVFMAAWYVLIVAGLILTMRASFVQEPQPIRTAWLVVGTVAMLLADSPISWDLRNANSNLVYLGIVMAGYGLLGGLPIVAGALIGLSFSLKLYSGLLLLWLLINGPRRAAGAAAMTILFLWIMLPVALVGPDGTRGLYAGWIEQLRTISDPLVHARLAAEEGGPPLVTLQRAIVNLSGEAYGSAATLARLSILWSIWLAALLWYAWQCRRSAFPVVAPSRAALADWTVLLLAPLPFSPWLEPYHCVVLFVGALLCVIIALDENAVRGDRMAALAAVATLLLFLVVRVPFAVRGFGLFAQLLVFVLVLAYLRPRLRQQADDHIARVGAA
jgi:hypothetical protein